MSDHNWTKLHKDYKKQDWVSKPSMFAEFAVPYFPKQGKLLDLGAGRGQDSIFFANHGYQVVATDLEAGALQETIQELNSSIKGRITVQSVDLRQRLDFEDNSFDVVYAHLSLHYFDKQTTERIFDDIYRVLKPGGIFAFFTNTVEDPEYDTGTKIEDDYYEIEGVAKRYFTVESAKEFARAFAPLLADNKGETYKDSAKGIHNLIRFIGKKA